MIWLATLDRFEGHLAVLAPVGRAPARFTMDRALLPSGAREGTILRFTVEEDPAATENARAEIERLQAELAGEEFPPDQ